MAKKNLAEEILDEVAGNKRARRKTVYTRTGRRRTIYSTPRCSKQMSIFKTILKLIKQLLSLRSSSRR